MNQEKETSYNEKIRYILYLLILIGGLLRVYGLSQKSLWVDELASLNVSKDYHLLLNYCAQRNTPPLRNILIHLLTQLQFIPTETAVRLPSMIAGIFSIYFIFLLGKNFVNEKVGLISAVLLTFSPWHIFHSQDGRMYAVILCLGLASSIFMLRSLNGDLKNRHHSIWNWIFFALFNVANAYISYFGIFIIVAQYGYIFLKVLLRYFSEKDFKVVLKVMNRVILSGLIMFLIYLPWLIYSPKDIENTKTQGVLLKILDQYGVIKGTPQQKAPIQEDEVARGPAFNPFTTKFDYAYFNNLLDEFGSKNLNWIYLILFITGLIFSFFKHRDLFLFSIIFIIVPLIILLITNAGWFFPPRYLSYEMIVYLSLCSISVYYLLLMIKKIINNSVLRNTGYIFAILILLITFVSFNSPEIYGYYKSEKQDWKGVARYIEENVKDGDTVIAGAFWSPLGLLQYVTDYSKNVRLVVDCIYEEDFMYEVYQPKRIWYVTWGPIPDFIDRHVKNNFKLVKTFPGMLGDIQVYKKEPSQFDYEMYEKIKDQLETLKRQKSNKS